MAVCEWPVLPVIDVVDMVRKGSIGMILKNQMEGGIMKHIVEYAIDALFA